MTLLPSLCLITKNIGLIIAGLVGFSFIIGFHELGHFLFCKLFGVRTPSFSIGFGPKLMSKKLGETEFSVSAIPFGGYVEIAGASEVGQGEQKDAYAQDAGSFAIKPWYQKALILLGGIIFNLAFAYMAVCLVFLTGAPKGNFLYPLNASSRVASVEPESPAAHSGIKAGDTLLEINGVIIPNDNSERHAESIATALKYVREHPSNQIDIMIEREGSRTQVPLVIGTKDVMGSPLGYLGVGFVPQDLPPFSLIQAIKQGITVTNGWIVMTISAFRHLFASRDTSQLGGPISILSAISMSAGQGIKIFLLLLALISVNLAILNLIPIPILDGGQLVFYTIEALAGRQLPIKVKEYIHIACWVAFLALIVILSAKDLGRMLAPYIDHLRALLGK
ncbi:MAG: M50 family metallopeptidase [Candidatus Babeliales bacterium]